MSLKTCFCIQYLLKSYKSTSEFTNEIHTQYIMINSGASFITFLKIFPRLLLFEGLLLLISENVHKAMLI